jgi:GTP cyclohydrolase I
MSMQQSYANILTAVGEDLDRPGLKDTPVRAAKAFSYLTSGYSKTLEEVTNNAVFPSDNHEMVLVKNIEFLFALRTSSPPILRSCSCCLFTGRQSSWLI